MIRQAFNRAGAKPEGSSGNDFLEAILRERPDLKDQTAYFPEQGCHSHTVIIGDEVFKGPNWSNTLWAFDQEHKILKALEGKGLPIPKVTCVGKEVFFYGMTRMQGVRLDDDSICFTIEEQRILAKDIVNFVVGMACALPSQDGKFLFHADFHENNIMIDPKTKRLSGVIDFEMTSYGYKPYLCPSLYKIFGSSFDNGNLLQEEYAIRKKEIPDAPSSKDAVPQKSLPI